MSGNTAVATQEYRGVWVFGEQIDGMIQGVVYELVGKGRELADRLGVPLTVLVLGHGLDAACAMLLDYPVDSVIQVDDPALAAYAAEPYSRVVADLIGREKPEILLAGATAIGRSFLPRVGVAVNTGITADCVALAIDDKHRLVQTCPGFGGSVMASILCVNHRPQMATVRPRVMPAAERGARGGSVTKINPDTRLLSSRTKRLEWLPEVFDTVNLNETDVIVAGGRGMGGKEGFALLEKLAGLLKGAVGATRAPVDEGWIGYSRQIGQTGKTVQPKLYIACGISGAIQHTVGMSAADYVIAVNRDRDAPIFSRADYGVVGDVFEILPAMIHDLEVEFSRKSGKPPPDFLENC